MQAIQTKFLPCTDARGSRVKAWVEAGSVTIGWDHALNVEENHKAAAERLRQKLGWDTPNYGNIIGGSLPSGGYAFNFLPKQPKTLFVFGIESEKVSRTYGGSDVVVRVYEIVNGETVFVCRAKWCTRSYKGAESEVMNAIAYSGRISEEFKTGYYKNYESPFTIRAI